MPYQDYQQRIAPPWLQGPAGGTLLAAEGIQKDQALAAMKDAVKASMVRLAPADALPGLGADAALERLPNESDASYRARIAGAWDAWALAGTDAAVLGQLALLGYPASYTLTPRDWSPDPAGLARWAREWVILAPVPAAWRADDPWGAVGTWGDGSDWDDGGGWGGTASWDDGGTWGSNVDADDVAAVTRLVTKWKSARDRAWVVVLLAGDLWGPWTPWAEGTWGGAVMFWPVN